MDNLKVLLTEPHSHFHHLFTFVSLLVLQESAYRAANC